MGKFRNQKKNQKKNKVTMSIGKVKKMRREAKEKKTDGDDVVMVEEEEAGQRVRGLSVKSSKQLANGELKNVPKVNEKKILRRFELPVKEKKKLLDVPSGNPSAVPQFITKKKAKKLYKRMTHDARDMFKKVQKELAEEGNGDVQMDS